MERLAPEIIEIQYPETLRRLEVAWVDAESSAGYKIEGNKYAVGIRNLEIGFLIAETDMWLILGSETWEETGAEESKGFRRTVSIPKVNVTSVVELIKRPEPSAVEVPALANDTEFFERPEPPVTSGSSPTSNTYTEVSVPVLNAKYVLPLETVYEAGKNAEQFPDFPF